MKEYKSSIVSFKYVVDYKINMEKKWIGNVLVVFGLVLVVFAVGYSAGNSLTGYGIFDKIFSKTESRTNIQSPTTPTQPTGSNSGMDSRITQVAPNLFKGSRGMSHSEVSQFISSNSVKVADGTTCTPPEGECLFVTEEGECIEAADAGCTVQSCGSSGMNCCCTSGPLPYCTVV